MLLALEVLGLAWTNTLPLDHRHERTVSTFREPSDSLAHAPPVSRRDQPAIRRFIEQLACILEHHTNKDDIELLPLLMLATNSTPGVFVEIGANDGFSDSQTWLLERCLGWTGVLIEAQPDIFRLLEKSKRTAKKVNAAACNRGNVTMTGVGVRKDGSVDERRTGVSGAIELMTARYMKNWRGLLDLQNVSVVPCIPLDRIIHDAGFSHVDFISVDVQGAEYDVLSTADPRMFNVIMVEAESLLMGGRGVAGRVDKNERVRQLLRRAGHRQINLTTVGWDKAGHNDLFVRPPLDALDPRSIWGASGIRRVGVPFERMVRARESKAVSRLLDGFLAVAQLPSANFAQHPWTPSVGPPPSPPAEASEVGARRARPPRLQHGRGRHSS